MDAFIFFSFFKNKQQKRLFTKFKVNIPAFLCFFLFLKINSKKIIY